MRRIVIDTKPGRKTSCATRTRGKNKSFVTKEMKKRAKLGRVGMFDFEFTLVSTPDNPRKSSTIISTKSIKTDSYDDAVLYAQYNTPAGHQGLIDGQSVVCK